MIKLSTLRNVAAIHPATGSDDSFDSHNDLKVWELLPLYRWEY